jgi:hypothetical protein
LIWCLLSHPRTLEQLHSLTQWIAEDIGTALELLARIGMAAKNGNEWTQAGEGISHLVVNPECRLYWEEMVLRNIHDFIVPEMEAVKASGADPDDEPLKFKANYNLIHQFTVEQQAVLYEKYMDIYRTIQTMIRDNNIRGYRDAEAFRLVQVKLLLFDYFNPAQPTQAVSTASEK